MWINFGPLLFHWSDSSLRETDERFKREFLEVPQASGGKKLRLVAALSFFMIHIHHVFDISLNLFSTSPRGKCKAIALHKTLCSVQQLLPN